jgi:pilus assembly protein CpaE
MEKGVSDYIVPPFHPISLIRSMGELYSDPEKPFIGRVAAFFGAKGGVGSSTIAHNIAWALSENIQQETALVDLDASWGTTGLDFAYDASQGLEEALAEPDRLDETLLDRIMIRHTDKLSILPTAGSLHHKAVTSPDAYEAVVNGVRSISPMTILDMPHHWTDWTTNILINSDDVVITATPDLANLRNTKNLIDFLRAQRPNDAEPILILNKTGMTKTSEISVKDFAAAVGLEPALVLGFEPDVYFEASNDGKMLTEVKSAAQAVSGLEYIAQRLKTGQFGTQSAATGKGNSILGKLSKPKAEGDSAKSGKPLFSFMKKGK